MSIDETPSIFQGSCQCQALRYRVTGIALALFACHCKDCQRQSASAFGMALWVRLGDVQLLNGQLREWVRTTPTGRHMSCQFCDRCGTRVFHRMADQPQVLSIKPGTLDDTSVLVPHGHLWKSSAQPWMVPLLRRAMHYECNPEDGFAALFAAALARPVGAGPPPGASTAPVADAPGTDDGRS